MPAISDYQLVSGALAPPSQADCFALGRSCQNDWTRLDAYAHGDELLRRRLVAGDTDQQVLNYIVARYGVFVLLNPPFEPVTWALWLGPPALVLGAGAILLLRVSRRRLDPRLLDLSPNGARPR